jgi:hypothetical protein
MDDTEDTDDEYTEDPVEDEDSEDDDAPRVPDPEAATPAPRADGAEVESIEDLIAKKEERKAGEDDDGLLLNLGREERLEPLAVKVVPPQPTEFVCKNCYLVKHQSQLKDKKRMFCRDCA